MIMPKAQPMASARMPSTSSDADSPSSGMIKDDPAEGLGGLARDHAEGCR
jgi:hypothetical protein